MKSLKGWVRFLLVTIGVVALTSFTVDATDTLRGSQSALSILMGSALDKQCPTGTVQIDLVNKSICVDAYENSVGPKCPIRTPGNSLHTKENIDTYACTADSRAGESPWTFVSYTQAKQLCVKKNMRLPSGNEWYEAGLGTPDTDVCNTEGSRIPTGESMQCVSSRGIYDAIGNVWEWTEGEVMEGVYQGRKLPKEGYVSEIDASGVAVMTSENANQLYNNDYFWANHTGVQAVLRGGFYGAGTDAGLYSVNSKVTPSFVSAAIGFRCVQDL